MEFFKTFTEQDMITRQTEIRAEMEAVDAALAANDTQALYELGYANKVDHPVHENMFRYEFRQVKYDEAKADLSKSPAALANELNALADR